MTRDIEQVLEQAALRQPTDQLDERIESIESLQLEPDDGANAYGRTESSGIAGRLGSALFVLAMAAAVAVAALLYRPWEPVAVPADDPTVKGNGSADYQPIRFDRNQVDVTPGEVFLIDRTPVRLLHRQSVDQTRWVDEANNVRIELTVPREDYYIVPVKVD